MSSRNLQNVYKYSKTYESKMKMNESVQRNKNNNKFIFFYLKMVYNYYYFIIIKNKDTNLKNVFFPLTHFFKMLKL